MKKLFAMLLALTMLAALLPMSVAADSWFNYANFKPINADKVEATKYDGTVVEISMEDYEALLEQYGDFLAAQEELRKAANHDPNKHSFNGYGSDTKYHWLQCACGCKISMEPHVDPLKAENDTCICGYQFSDNADLVTLWIDGCPPIKGFNKDKTEYKLNAYTYKDVKEIKVSTCTFDSEATVELPEDLTLKEGENKFEIKVTSENQKVTKIYTVIITKEAKK